MGPKLTPAEGFILGVGAKMFTIAGPVIVYGVSASVVYGLIYCPHKLGQSTGEKPFLYTAVFSFGLSLRRSVRYN